MLEGRQSFAAEFSGVGTVQLAHIIAGMHFQEYNVYSRAMGQGLTAPHGEGA